MAEQAAQALDRQADQAGALETLAGETAAATTTGARAVHQRALDQAREALARVEAVKRAVSSSDASGLGPAHEVVRAQVDAAMLAATDSGSATAAARQLDDLAQHAAEVTAVLEVELLATASAARELADTYSHQVDDQAEVPPDAGPDGDASASAGSP